MEKWTKAKKRHFIQEDTQMANQNIERCWTSFAIRNMQIKAIRYHDTPMRRAKTKQSKIVTTPNVGEAILEHSLSFSFKK